MWFYIVWYSIIGLLTICIQLAVWWEAILGCCNWNFNTNSAIKFYFTSWWFMNTNVEKKFGNTSFFKKSRNAKFKFILPGPFPVEHPVTVARVWYNKRIIIVWIWSWVWRFMAAACLSTLAPLSRCVLTRIQDLFAIFDESYMQSMSNWLASLSDLHTNAWFHSSPREEKI
jgi:hypothetical protein